MKKFICKGCHNPCVLETTAFPETCCFGTSKCLSTYCKWELEVTEDTPPKLTAEELARRGIEWPEWADGAVVHSDESASFYGGAEIKILWPPGHKGDWYIDGRAGKFQDIPGKWDASDWPHSLIKKPETKLPDWCKVGAWVWNSQEGYGIVSATTFVAGVVNVKFFKEKEDIGRIIDNLSEARLRPWTHKTIPNLPFAVNLRFSSHFTDTITTCSLSGVWFARHSREMVAFSTLMDIAIMLDGSPCGVLEHREGEGWVK